MECLGATSASESSDHPLAGARPRVQSGPRVNYEICGGRSAAMFARGGCGRAATSRDPMMFGSRGLSMFYALFQILVACVFLGFGNVTAYKIASSLVVKPETAWTPADRTAVEGYRDLKRLEKENSAAPLSGEAKARLDELRE